ncbi:replication protein B [Agrobacterium tumefaciens]|nr:replication protein B [Agrobacterium tumefaciens]
MLLAPALLKVATEYVETAGFVELTEDKRFDELHDYLKRYKAKSAAKKPKAAASGRNWTSSDTSLNFVMNAKSKKVAIELSNVEAKPFSEWLSAHMDRLYEEYKGSKPENNGD